MSHYHARYKSEEISPRAGGDVQAGGFGDGDNPFELAVTLVSAGVSWQRRINLPFCAENGRLAFQIIDILDDESEAFDNNDNVDVVGDDDNVDHVSTYDR